jgi:hypothetical protein
MALASAFVLLFATVAQAQTRPSPPARGVKKDKEFIVGGLFAGPVSLGTTQADLLNGSGDPSVTLLRTNNNLASGLGVEVNLGYQLKKEMWFEVSGGWTRLSFKSDIREDVEDAQGDSVSSPVSRFVVEGAVLFYLNKETLKSEVPAKSVWFLRFDGGWMRETAGGNTLTGDGFIGGAGIGMRHWWRTNGKGTFKRVGIRFEGRAVIRSGGLSLGDSSWSVGPAGAAHLVFGY